MKDSKELVFSFSIGSTMATLACSTSESQSKFKIDASSPLWKYVDMIQQVPGGGCYIWKCGGCDSQYNSSYF